MIATEGYYLSAAYSVFNLKCRLTHFDSGSLGFIAAGHDTPVVVAEHNDGSIFESRIESPLTADEEIITVG